MSDGGGGGGGGTIGYRYYMGLHMGVCRTPNEVAEIRFGDRTVTLRTAAATPITETTVQDVGDAGSIEVTQVVGETVAPLLTGAITDNLQAYIDSPDLFGGDAKEGGVQGPVNFLFGRPTQTPLAAITTMTGATETPAWRRVLTIFFDGLICSMSPYPKPPKFRVRRWDESWDGTVFAPTLAKIELTGQADPAYPSAVLQIKAMNPAHILWECYTNREWGRGLPASVLDSTVWTQAAQTLFNEGFGLCLKWDRTSKIEDFMQQVLDTIGANITQNRATGKLELRLMRADYTFSSLPVFDTNSGLLDISECTIGNPTECVNEMVVKWRDPISDSDKSTRAHNLAAIQSAGGAMNSASREYLGIPTQSLANRVALRELRLVSQPLRRFTMTLDRRAWQLYPGSVIRVRDLSRAIPDIAARVLTVDDGSLGSGRITIQAAQDVFSTPATAIVSEASSAWTPVNANPCLGRMRAFELPYTTLARYMSPADFAALTPESSRLGVVVDRSQSTNQSLAVAVRDGAPTPDDAAVDGSYYCGYTP